MLFSVDAVAHELPRAIGLLTELPKGALILGDRLYALPEFFRALSDNVISRSIPSKRSNSDFFHDSM
jgi:hypothetical protein